MNYIWGTWQNWLHFALATNALSSLIRKWEYQFYRNLADLISYNIIALILILVNIGKLWG